MIDRRFLNIRITIDGVISELPENPITGSQYLINSTPVGIGLNANYIAFFDGENWKYIPPRPVSMEIFNTATGEILRYNGTQWIAIFKTVTHELITEYHTLSESDISNKYLTLNNTIAQGYENKSLCFVGSAVHFYSIDFIATGDVVSWSGKTLENSLRAGDTIVIMYNV